MTRFRGAKPNKPQFSNDKKLPTPASSNDQKPVFSFEFMARGTGYSVACCENEELSSLASRMFALSQMSWLEIMQAPRHGLGTEKISQSSMKVALPKSVTEDVTLLALRYNGKKPMVGYRDNRVFHILFMDHDFTLYKHG